MEQLKLYELQTIVERLDLSVRDRRVRDDLIDVVVRAKRVRVPDVLAELSRDRLKDICLGLGLDDYGREKQLLIDRILGNDESDEEDEDVDDGAHRGGSEVEREPEVEHEALLKHMLGDAFTVEARGNAWPSVGTLRVGAVSRKVHIYARAIGSSARKNPLERRFQNPSASHGIRDPGDRFPLLFGLWQEQGEDRAVIVAFDAYLRIGRDTRYSMFMPLALLEQAADTGFAVHVNQRDETLYAFRPENLGRYIHTLLDQGVYLPSESDTDEMPAVPRTRSAESVDPTQTSDKLYIRPRVGMYAAFARLNYKPWFAIAEFLDNSIQSFLYHREALIAAGHDGPLIIDVSLDDNELSVTDRAGGIAWKDFPRAFSPAAAPADTSGLSEFGLGMKAAACWFSKLWSVRTSALGENVERTVTFDIPAISRDGVENLPIEVRPARESDHFTVITMRDLRQHPRTKTLAKVKEHLASIYRVLMKEGVARIRLTAAGRTEELMHEEPELLVAPYYRTPDRPPQRWYRDLDIPLGDRRVHGWVGILKEGSYAKAGFSVFRRQRLIEGSAGEAYKPQGLFGAPNSFASLRVVGELFVEGFDVTHTKDGIQWGGYEDDVLEAIRRHIEPPELPLLEQALGYRARKTADSLPRTFGREALESVELGLNQPQMRAVLGADIAPSEGADAELGDVPSRILQSREMTLSVVHDGAPWTLLIELIRDPAAPFYSTSEIVREGVKMLNVRVNLDHDFSIQYINENEEVLQPMLRFVAALALGERLARESGVKFVATVRACANDVLRALSATSSSSGGV